MSVFFDVLYFLGTKSLVVSILAQIVVIGVALKTKNAAQAWQGFILLLALSLLVGAIAIRPPAPINHLADSLGTASAFLFAWPAIHALLRLRQKSQSEEQ